MHEGKEKGHEDACNVASTKRNGFCVRDVRNN